jgi:hypothetical protein
LNFIGSGSANRCRRDGHGLQAGRYHQHGILTRDFDYLSNEAGVVAQGARAESFGLLAVDQHYGDTCTTSVLSG